MWILPHPQIPALLQGLCVSRPHAQMHPQPSAVLTRQRDQQTSQPLDLANPLCRARRALQLPPGVTPSVENLLSAASLLIDGTSTHGPHVSPPRKGSVGKGPGYPAQGLACSGHMLEPVFQAFGVSQDVSYVTFTYLSFLGRVMLILQMKSLRLEVAWG